MLKQTSTRLVVLVVAAAIVIVAAGGGAVASNMGFKINKALVLPPAVGATANQGRNWVSIPYNQPYTTGCIAPATAGCAKAFCDATNLTACGGVGATLLRNLNAVTGATTSSSCPSAALPNLGNNFPLIAGQFLDVRPTASCVTTNIIIVGSHNPSLAITVPASGAGLVGRKWFAVPYHTTAVTTRDLCVQAGLSLAIPAANITRLNPTTGNNTNTPCSANPGANLVLGEGVQITQPTTAVTFTPAHF